LLTTAPSIMTVILGMKTSCHSQYMVSGF